MDALSGIDVLVNLSETFPAIQRTIIVVAYMLGILASGMGLLHFISQQRRGQEASKLGLFALVGGVLLTGLTATFSGLTETFFGEGNPAQVLSGVAAGTDPTKVLIDVIINTTILMGWAFGVRGAWLIAGAGNEQHAGRFGQGLVRLGAGVIAVNIVPFLLGLASTVGVRDAAEAVLRM